MDHDLATRLRELSVPAGALGVCSLGQAGFLLKGQDGTLLAIDPYLSDRLATSSEFGPIGRWRRSFPPPLAPEALDVDAIVLTHEHPDHMDPMTLGPALTARQVPVVGPAVLGPEVERLGGLFRPAVVGEPLDLGGVRIHPVPAAHAVTYTGPTCYDVVVEDGHHRFLGFVVELADGVTVYHAGDTIPHPEIDRVVGELRPRVSLLPVNGRDRIREDMGIVGNLTVREAAHLAAVARTRWLVPSHHDLFAVNSESVTTFVDVLDRQFSDQEYLVLKPGRPLVLGT
jgi:L-ascorbate 6-phosphate lactonase